MFTGIVQALAKVSRVEQKPPGCLLVVYSPEVAADAVIGESIALNGCCLTLVAALDGHIHFEAGPETLSRTNLNSLKPGSRVNVERSLQVGDRLGGHFVTGHIDGQGRLIRREDDRDWSSFWFAADEALCRQMVPKGSIAIDGVSLTLVNVADDNFSVALIPHTLTVTTLGSLAPGDTVNLETDLIGKYVQKNLAEVSYPSPSGRG